MYNLRPFNYELIKACASNTSCANCPMRTGCIVRYKFYEYSNISFEILMQITEIHVTGTRDIPSNLVYNAANQLRKKRREELGVNSSFSYT